MNRKNIPVLTDETQKKSIEFLNNLEALLNDYLDSLTTEERIRLRKMSDDDVEFVHKCLRAAEISSQFLPVNFDMVNFQRITALFDKMQPVMVRYEMLAEKLADTMMVIRNIMITRAEEVYSILKQASKKNGSLKAMMDDIGEHYKGRGPKKKKPKSE